MDAESNKRWCESLELRKDGTAMQRCLDAMLRYPIFTRLVVGTVLRDGKEIEHVWLLTQYEIVRDPTFIDLAGEYRPTKSYTSKEVIELVISKHKRPF